MGLAVLEKLSGEATGVEDPFVMFVAGMAGQDLQPDQQEAIGRAAAVVVHQCGSTWLSAR
ncbi:hypothetical protein [Agrobacterium pusense]|uniref:hypothetical protein n=1 Tax=Agrobacterium pusense TaxID=648995 RepID=UPI0028971B76|nr:hypothetical protein [Agrobacterium pusense]